MFEGVEFAKGAQNIPQEARVVIEADQKMQFYEVGIRVIAKFGGLRFVSLLPLSFFQSSRMQVHGRSNGMADGSCTTIV